MHLYAFGSVCRGEVADGSDLDLLAIVDVYNPQLDREMFSIYSYARIRELWKAGNPFAWHLAKESRLLHAGDGHDFLRGLRAPARYSNCALDCARFRDLFGDAVQAFRVGPGSGSRTFDLSTMFLAIRNIATCYALGRREFNFGRHAALRLGPSSLVVDGRVYGVLERARLLCTRGHGAAPTTAEIETVAGEVDAIGEWMESLARKARPL